MRKRSLVLISIILIFNFLHAQQTNIWYFGRKAGLDFNQLFATPVLNSVMDADEGSSSICDSDGNLLFYTNGITVFNRHHQVMLNGNSLLGNISTVQSGLIISRPGSNTLFYIFTSDAFENSFANGYRYSIVDMAGDNGKGEVIAKNIILSSSCTERMSAVRHADGVSIWLITNDRSSNRFRSWMIDCNGLSTAPVISVAGEVLNSHELMNVGMLKVSPDGKQLCQTHFLLYDELQPSPSFFQLFDFDNATGNISNARKVDFGNAQITGCEYSPNSTLLYLTRPHDNAIDQVESRRPDIADIMSSRYTIRTPGSGFFGIQLAPDRKIYLARPSSLLGAINSPDVKGEGCNFQDEQLDLSQGTRASAYLGLPTILNDISSNYNNGIKSTIVDSCTGTVQFNGVSTMQGSLSWEWDFGDGLTSFIQNPLHTFSPAQQFYTVKLRIQQINGCGLVERSEKIYPGGILLNPDFDFTVPCDSDYVRFINTSVFLPDSSSVEYHWDFGDGNTSSSPNPVHHFSAPGTFNVTLNIQNTAGCLARSVTQAVNFEEFDVHAPPEMVISPGETAQLFVTGGGSSFLWTPPEGLSNPAIANPVASPMISTTYVVTASNDAGCKDTDSVFIKVKQLPGIYVPSAFTPNNDGKNDYFRPVLSDEFMLREFTIYNRWGQMIFRTSENGAGWNGYVGGIRQATGVYVWSISAIDNRTGLKQEMKGTFTIIR